MNSHAVLACGMLVALSSLSAQAQGLAGWEGTFRGPCTNLRGGASTSNVDFTMERSIIKIPGTDRYEWRSTFNGGEPGTGKNYQLVSVQPAAGRYQIDEGGGVRIDSYLSGNTLYSHFEVGNVQITNIERLEGDRLTTELLSFENRALSPNAAVKSFRFQVNQRCVLERL